MDLMLQSGLFFAVFPPWQGRLGEAGREELLDHMERLDVIFRADLTFSENLLWALFLTPYLHQEDLPDSLAELREDLPVHIRNAGGTIDFPRQRLEEVTQILALAEIIDLYLKKGQTIPGRLSRLAAFGEARLFHRLCTAPLEEIVALLTQTELPAAPPPRRRRPRRRRPRGAPRHPVKV
jgi:hypothetical protein